MFSLLFVVGGSTGTGSVVAVVVVFAFGAHPNGRFGRSPLFEALDGGAVFQVLNQSTQNGWIEVKITFPVFGVEIGRQYDSSSAAGLEASLSRFLVKMMIVLVWHGWLFGWLVGWLVS